MFYNILHSVLLCIVCALPCHYHRLLTISPSLAASLEHLTHDQNVASLRLPIGITWVDVYLNWPNWLHFLILKGDLLMF